MQEYPVTTRVSSNYKSIQELQEYPVTTKVSSNYKNIQ